MSLGGGRAPAPLHPQAVAVMAAEEGAPPPTDVAALRRSHTEAALRFGGTREEVSAVEDLEVAGRPARLFRPLLDLADPPGLLVWLHGGGWVMGDLDGFDHVCRSLANASGHRVLCVDYRLAPEHPFPAPLEDCLAALEWATTTTDRGWRADRVLVGGDSAGGNLAAVCARRLGSRLRGQLLAYPAVDAAGDTASWTTYGEVPLLTAGSMRQAWEAYLAGHDPADPDASPLRAGREALAAAPPALVVVAGHDVLRDEGLAYADALAAAGVPVEREEAADMPHSFLRWGGVAERAGELLLLLGATARRMLAEPDAVG